MKSLFFLKGLVLLGLILFVLRILLGLIQNFYESCWGLSRMFTNPVGAYPILFRILLGLIHIFCMTFVGTYPDCLRIVLGLMLELMRNLYVSCWGLPTSFQHTGCAYPHAAGGYSWFVMTVCWGFCWGLSMFFSSRK